MAMTDTTPLGCGRDIDSVWDDLDDPPSPHEQECPHCRSARQSLAVLHAATRHMNLADADDLTLQTSTDVIDNILSIARAEVRRGRRIPLRPPGPDQLDADLMVSEQAVASIIRRVSDRIPGLETRRCRVQVADSSLTTPDPGSTPVSDTTDVDISIRVSVSAGASIPDLVRTLRTQTIAALDREIGIRVATLDVSVEDIHNAA